MSLLALALLVAAAPAEYHGYISDEACGWNNAREGKEAKECARVCVKGGWPPVFVRDGGMAVFKIPAKADVEKVMPFVGDHVTVTGVLEKGVLKVEKVRLSAPPPARKK